MKIDILHTGDKEIKEVIVRKGDAPPYKPKKSLSIAGTLGAPFQFLLGRKVDDQTTHLKILKADGQLHLFVGDTDPETTHNIVGQLNKDKVLQSFGINTPQRYSVRDFVKFIKTVAFFFASREEHTALVKNLQTWSVKVEKVIKEVNDNSGNSEYVLQTKVSEIELKNQFDLFIPIYQGYAKKKFKVEIGFDPRNNGVDLFLISDELYELEITFREQLIDEEVAKFSDKKFSKLVIN